MSLEALGIGLFVASLFIGIPASILFTSDRDSELKRIIACCLLALIGLFIGLAALLAK